MHEKKMFDFRNILLHIVVPVLAFVDYALFCPKNTMNYKQIWIFLIYPAIYTCLVYLRVVFGGGAFVSGFSMCMLNTVVNPMLNTLGGGGNKGNQLIQLGGSCNSMAATIVPVLAGYLIGEVTEKTQVADVNLALFIAMAIFALAFVIIFFSNIPEPELEAKAENQSILLAP